MSLDTDTTTIEKHLVIKHSKLVFILHALDVFNDRDKLQRNGDNIVKTGINCRGRQTTL